MSAAEVWLAGFLVGFTAAVPFALLVDRVLDALTRPFDDHRRS